VLLDWAMPAARKPIARGGRTILFPASALGRKGAYELRAALSGLEAELVVAGGATEHDGAFCPAAWASAPASSPSRSSTPRHCARRWNGC